MAKPKHQEIVQTPLGLLQSSCYDTTDLEGSISEIKILGRINNFQVGNGIFASNTFKLQEVDILTKLDHPNVVKLFKSERADDTIFIWCERLAQTLQSFIARHGPMDSNHIKRLGYQILQGLQHIHSKGFIHKGLCGKNISAIS